MAGTHGSSSVIVVFNSKTMTSYITKLSGFERTPQIEDTTPFGATDSTSGYSGLNKTAPITIEGFYDDTATDGPDAVFLGASSAALGVFATLVVTWASGKTTSCSAAPVSYARKPAVGKLTGYSVVLQPSGVVTEA